MTQLSGYALEPLRQDQEFVLYRGRRPGDQSHILVLTPAAEHPAPASLKRLEHAYELRDELDPAWAARPVTLVQHNGKPALLIEDHGGELLAQTLGKPWQVALFLRIATGLAAALVKLHERGLIHKDIKPANIFVNVATGATWLTGFDIASRAPRERQAPESPEMIAGTLAYMAPEQTGRMNRSVDTRSDLYSFGVTLYEMLTGDLPFTASEPIEWVHCHIARQPVSPTERVPGVPAPIAAIVLKLLAKNAEDRYQTAVGVELDLRKCLMDWEIHGRIAPFPLGTRDIPDRLLIPEKLYGREQESDALLASFDRVVASGTPELVLVSGYSGVGKSSVVHELHKLLVPSRGLFASGKFDQYKRDVPYATLAQAFQGLIRPLLGKSETELDSWRDAFREALGPNGRLMVNLVPELELIIGEQPPVADLPPQEEQGRFQLVFRRFIGVFARQEHPLALFLDDLQWLDAATLDLFEDLLTRPDVQHLLLIGAYRDNEVNSAHPLMRKLEAIRKAGAKIQEIILAPLAREDLERLIADSLHCEAERVTPLAQLVQEKTAGNPFFAIQFISALAEEALLVFDHGHARWSWDLESIHVRGYTDNVVDLMVGKLSRLPVKTQKALQQLACLGNSAEIATLSIVHGTSEEELHSDLWDAVGLELIVRTEGFYRFVHDRVQEAAYSLIPEKLRAESHLRIGRLLAAHTPPEGREEAIFEIVNQFNRGAALITSQDERAELAQLNLLAGTRAKATTAYVSALKYFIAGAALLADDCWERQYELSFPLELHRAECEFLTGDLAAADERLSLLSCRATNLVDLAAVTCLRVGLYTTLDQSDRAVKICLDYLRQIGVTWSPYPTDEEIRQEYERMWQSIGTRPIEALTELPVMTDPDWCATMAVLAEAFPPALFTDKNLHHLFLGRMANLSLEHGNCDGSCLAYVYLGMVLGPRFGEYAAGFRFGQLGFDLVEKGGLDRFKARVCLVFGHLVVPWGRHLSAGRPLIRRVFDTAREIGDLTFAAYSCNNMITNLLASGDPLGQVQREAESGFEFARRARFGLAADFIAGQLQLIRTLRGLTPDFGSFNDAQFDEGWFERHLDDIPHLGMAACWYWIRKLQARYYAADYNSAIEAASKAQLLLWTSPSHFEVAEYHFYGALARAALYGVASADERTDHIEALVAHHRQLELWAENGPENFSNRAALVAAEIARIEGRELNAMRLYEEAIRLAREHGFIQNEGLANELAGRFYAECGFETIASAYLRNARYCYLRWGADGKVRQLDQLHPQLREESPVSDPTTTIEASVEHLDLGTIIKVSQAVSGEIVLEKLIDTLMRTATEHAGAERGLLILARDNELRIEAEANTGRDTVEVFPQQTVVTPSALPESVFHYVIRTKETVILDDALATNQFSADAYIRQNHSRSILCLPLVKQAKLAGVLYLENNLASHVFTPARIAVLKVLASQAAISLENARLYADSREMEAYLQAAQRLSHTGSFGWRPATGEVIWSEEIYRIAEYDRAAKPTVDLVLQRIHPKDIARVQETLERGLQNGTDLDFEHRFLMPDGSVKYVHVVARAIRDGEGHLEYIGAVMDLTERKRAEEELHKARSELAHVTRVMTMGELTTSIAHEVNQPLAAIVTNANAAARWLTAAKPNLHETREALGRIVRDGNRAAEVIARIRALVQKTETERVPLDINDAIREAVNLAEDEVRRTGVALRVQLAGDLPLVLGDRVQLQQVVLNLIMNAIEAMSAVQDRPRDLTISTQNGDIDQVCVSVQDSGIGLDPKSMKRIFDAFYTTKPAGLGIGLAISRSIIENHGGRLWASPNDGPGTTFHFTLIKLC